MSMQGQELSAGSTHNGLAWAGRDSCDDARMVPKSQTAPRSQSRRTRLSRIDRTRARVLAATARILDRDGYARLTMERVAAESGAAKTTVYRWWPSKAALC